VVERFVSLPRGLEKHPKVLLDAWLTEELVECYRSERPFEVTIGWGGGRIDSRLS
jgi:hypothetical protein